MKTLQKGYYELKIDENTSKWLHFSTNCWFNLKEDAGKTIADWGKEYDKLDDLGQFGFLCDISYAAIKAYDQEEDNKIDYNLYKVREWMTSLTEKDSVDFIKAMSWSLSIPKEKK